MTVTLQVAERSLPSLVETVIVASPGAMALTTPSATVATLSLEVVHVRSLGRHVFREDCRREGYGLTYEKFGCSLVELD